MLYFIPVADQLAQGVESIQLQAVKELSDLSNWDETLFAQKPSYVDGLEIEALYSVLDNLKFVKESSKSVHMNLLAISPPRQIWSLHLSWIPLSNRQSGD